MRNLFIDTNIIIDVLANRQPFSEASSRLFDYAEKGKLNLFISALSYSNIYYIIKKTCSHKEMISLLRDLEELTETLDVTKQIISKSLNSDFKDFEDSIQYYTATSNKKITGIVTRNVKDYKNSELTVWTPDEVLSAIDSPGS
ncbi:PIN domain-containing protein [Pseudoflavitalea sp. X16]|uniref:type II toxin-antitoxin system VapC family toxin n=1 Tax=Paraflavitalea devenefica TaxID=2716334 RepID=UPI001423C534|nr:PIN domain-containing protein [Paraflavitalea devenefica]NII29689.1 PIN domain-containing protein [Paraflavitalea devenefica]